MWHGACWSSALEAASGIVDLVSSKTARLRRRHAARRKMAKRPRKAGRVPQHTRAEQRRAEAERQRQRQQEADRCRQIWRRRTMIPLSALIGAAAITFIYSSKASDRHNLYE